MIELNVESKNLQHSMSEMSARVWCVPDANDCNCCMVLRMAAPAVIEYAQIHHAGTSLELSARDCELTTSLDSRGMRTLAIARPLAGEVASQLAVTARMSEGRAASIAVIMVTQPGAAYSTLARVPALMYHVVDRVPVTNADEDSSDLIMSCLTIEGPFSTIQAREWLSTCLADLPAPNTGSSDTEQRARYTHPTLGTQLSISYSKGRIVARSDGPSALAILRDSINGRAAALRVRLSVRFDIHALAAHHVLELLGPRIAAAQSALHRSQLADAVKEVRAADNSGAERAFAQPDLRGLAGAEGAALKAEAAAIEEDRRLETYYGLVTGGCLCYCPR